MNKYLLLLICFFSSLLFVGYEDNSDVVMRKNVNESVYVFYEVEDNVVSNPDTSDIDIYLFYLIGLYSFILVIMLYFDRKRFVKYMDVVIE